MLCEIAQHQLHVGVAAVIVDVAVHRMLARDRPEDEPASELVPPGDGDGREPDGEGPEVDGALHQGPLCVERH